MLKEYSVKNVLSKFASIGTDIGMKSRLDIKETENRDDLLGNLGY